MLVLYLCTSICANHEVTRTRRKAWRKLHGRKHASAWCRVLSCLVNRIASHRIASLRSGALAERPPGSRSVHPLPTILKNALYNLLLLSTPPARAHAAPQAAGADPPTPGKGEGSSSSGSKNASGDSGAKKKKDPEARARRKALAKVKSTLGRLQRRVDGFWYSKHAFAGASGFRKRVLLVRRDRPTDRPLWCFVCVFSGGGVA